MTGVFRVFCVISAVGLFVVGMTRADAQTPAGTAQMPPAAVQGGNGAAQAGSAVVVDQLSEFQKESLEIERQRLTLQRDQLALDREKSGWTFLGVAVPLMAAVVALMAGIITMFFQARAQFNMKAAELVLGSYSPAAAKSRAAMLSRMFSHWLRADFPQSFSANEFPGTRLQEMKMELFRALRAKDADPEQVVRHWLAVFDGEKSRFSELFPDLATPGQATNTPNQKS
ncbi:hypothetical protein [Bradyrhizobium canariense]|uniref:Uncharacterized protein n=1 Tax=Bradyrhizobium canariense TaxID=255045 RepID=A0A1H2AGY7_9BRAD|nr:hypothetical protein [Bradyrhizobium canariense]SDT45079.1 hypothetical protein SAMN05444158_6145 [Bradyrhizobium canariense]